MVKTGSSDKMPEEELASNISKQILSSKLNIDEVLMWLFYDLNDSKSRPHFDLIEKGFRDYLQSCPKVNQYHQTITSILGIHEGVGTYGDLVVMKHHQDYRIGDIIQYSVSVGEGEKRFIGLEYLKITQVDDKHVIGRRLRVGWQKPEVVHKLDVRGIVQKSILVGSKEWHEYKNMVGLKEMIVRIDYKLDNIKSDLKKGRQNDLKQEMSILQKQRSLLVSIQKSK